MLCASRTFRVVGLATPRTSASAVITVSNLCRRVNAYCSLTSTVRNVCGLASAPAEWLSTEQPAGKPLRFAQPVGSPAHQRMSFSTTNSDAQLDLDALCHNHMELPEQDFVLGCSFLHKVALGTPPNELERRFDLFNNKRLVNFRDYDRRTGKLKIMRKEHV